MVKTAAITNDLRTAMRQREAFRVSVLRLMVAALTNARIAKKQDLTEDEEITVLNQEVKKRKEAIELYEQGKRPELAQKEAEEIKLIQAYLPQLMTAAEIKTAVEQLKAAGTLPDDFGQAMRVAMAQFKGKAEGQLVAAAVKETL